jgi:hypothetical protein
MYSFISFGEMSNKTQVNMPKWRIEINAMIENMELYTSLHGNNNNKNNKIPDIIDLT